MLLRAGSSMGVAMRSWKRWAGSGLAAVMVAAGLTTVVGAPSASAANSTKCPLNALKAAKKPVEITLWHSMNRGLGDTLTKLTDQFNASQSDVKVNLVNQIDYTTTFTKYKAGLASGDLPD